MQGTMRAVVLTGHGDLDRLRYKTAWPAPSPGPHEVLIRVQACGLNNTDVNTRTGWYSREVTERTTGASYTAADPADGTWGRSSLTFPRIQGADIVGVVEAVGSLTDPALVGRRVLVDPWLRDWDDPLDPDRIGYLGSEHDGGFAELVALDHRQVHPVDSPLDSPALATFPTAYVTAENMLDRAAVAQGDTVLVPGGSGGVGSALIQLARRRGARTVALCSEDKAEAVRKLRPDAILPREPSSLRSALEKAIGASHVTVVADTVAGALWPQLIEALAPGGRYVCAGAIAGPIVPFDLRTFYLRDLTLVGATVVPPGTFARLVAYIERGEVEPMLAGVWPLSDLAAAQAAFIEKRHVGNLVVKVPE